jgi:hypothetical protein
MHPAPKGPLPLITLSAPHRTRPAVCPMRDIAVGWPGLTQKGKWCQFIYSGRNDRKKEATPSTRCPGSIGRCGLTANQVPHRPGSTSVLGRLAGVLERAAMCTISAARRVEKNCDKKSCKRRSAYLQCPAFTCAAKRPKADASTLASRGQDAAEQTGNVPVASNNETGIEHPEASWPARPDCQASPAPARHRLGARSARWVRAVP